MKNSARCRRRRNSSQYERTSDYRLEINIAFQEIDCAFQDCHHRPFRIARKWDGDQDFLELAFITPGIAVQYHELIQDLELWTLWEIRIRKTPNEHAVLEAVRNTVPNGFRLIRTPGICNDRTSVCVHCDGDIPEEMGDAWSKIIRNITGLELVICPDPPVGDSGS